jgi:hypothetical protein
MVTAWLWATHWHGLPLEDPGGNGWQAQVWKLGGLFGKTSSLAAVTFAAYLLGSALEIDPTHPWFTSIASFTIWTPRRRRGQRSEDGEREGAGYRRAIDEATLVERLGAVFAEPASLLAGAVTVGDPVAVLPVLFGMLWRGDLAADLDTCRLAPATLVRAREGVASGQVAGTAVVRPAG